MLKLLQLFLFISITACTSTTIILSHPMGALVYMDNSLVGKTPYVYTDRKWFLGSSKLRLEKEGYKTVEVMLKRSQEWDVGAILGFFSLPWCRKYSAEQYYPLKEQNSSRFEK